MKKKWSIIRIYNVYSIAIGTVLMISISSLIYVYVNLQQLNDKFNKRYTSYQLADELRQSSDDLTRMARTFVVTGDQKYEKAYFDILDIRNGKKARPEKYNQIYWDLAITGDNDNRENERAIPLKDLMKEAGFTEQEFGKLQEAQNNSDDLVETETIAMNTIKALGQNANDTSAMNGITRDKAITMMHDNNYHAYKYKIMKPLDDFFDLLDQRTLNDVLEYQKKNNVMMFVLIVLPVIIFGFLLTFYIALRKRMIVPILKLSEYSNTIAKGNFDTSLPVRYDDEIGNLSNAINQVARAIREKSAFVSEIGKANLNVNLQPLSDKDAMAYALIEMKENLVKISLQEKKRNWATEGLAKFGDLLRRSGSVEEVFSTVLSELVKYVDANQGAIYMVQEEKGQEFLQMLCCYAWGRKKFVTDKIERGEGLAGQAWQENMMIHLREIPENYIRIKSGLGESCPTSIIIVPLKTNANTLGILELASLKKFEEHETEFLSNLAENIASVLLTLKNAEQTKQLLQQSQLQTEELRSKEEEMRQNMEELSSTQEEMARKEQDYIVLIDELKKKAGVESVGMP